MLFNKITNPLIIAVIIIIGLYIIYAKPYYHGYKSGYKQGTYDKKRLESLRYSMDSLKKANQKFYDWYYQATPADKKDFHSQIRP